MGGSRMLERIPSEEELLETMGEEKYKSIS